MTSQIPIEETDVAEATGETESVLEWEGAPSVSFKGKSGKQDWHYKHERLVEGSSPCRTASPKLALRRIVNVAPNQDSPSARQLRQRSRERSMPKEMQPETITVHASDFEKYGDDVNKLRDCKIEDDLARTQLPQDPEEYVQNPWAGKTKHLHDLLMRESQDDSGINQKWFPPPTTTGRYETPSPGPKRRYYGCDGRYGCSETSTRTPSPATAQPDAAGTPRKDSRPRSRAPSPGRQARQPLQNCRSSAVYVAAPCLPPRSPANPCPRRRAPPVAEGRSDSRGRRPEVFVSAGIETQTMRLPPRLPQRPGTRGIPCC